MRATGIQSVLVVMGDGSEWHRLQKLVQIYDLPDRIVLAGFVPDAASRLAALDIFTLTSRSEALGYALLEAGNAGLPAIGTRVGGIPEIVKDGETGLLVPADDALALEEALSALARDPQLRERLGYALKARVASDFSVETMTARTLALYAAS